MGRVDANSAAGGDQVLGKSKRKSKGRMNYLKRRRAQGAGKGEAKTDEHGQLYGDYEPVTTYGHGQSAQGQGQGGRFRKWQGAGSGNSTGFNRKKPKEFLKPGMKGFLCTTNNYREWECVRDAYNILNEYSEEKDDKAKPVEVKVEDGEKQETQGGETGGSKSKEDPAPAPNETETSRSDSPMEVQQEQEDVPLEELAVKTTEKKDEKVPEETKVKEEDAQKVNADESGVKESQQQEQSSIKNVKIEIAEKSGKGEKNSDEDDIDSALNNELNELKNEKTAWKFQSVDTGTYNVVFIKTTIDNPTDLAYKIYEDLSAKKQVKSRNIMRFLPIEITCSVNNMEEVKARVSELVDKHIKTGYVSYKIACNIRFNNWIQKDDVVLSLAEMISRANPLSFVDLNDPQFTILIEVIKNTMCLGIVKDFMKYKRFNLYEVGSNFHHNYRQGGRGRNKNGKAGDKVDGQDTSDAKKEETEKVQSANEDAPVAENNSGGADEPQSSLPAEKKADEVVAQADSQPKEVEDKPPSPMEQETPAAETSAKE